MNAYLERDLETLWRMTRKEATDPTLTREEKARLFSEFEGSWPASLGPQFSTLEAIAAYKPLITTINSNDPSEIILQAEYRDNEGYLFDDYKIAKRISFTIKIDSQELVSQAQFGEILLLDEAGTNHQKVLFAKSSYDAFLKKPEEEGRRIRKILELYPSAKTPIPELNREIFRVLYFIDQKKFSDLVNTSEIGGYSDKGTLISVSQGFGTKLVDFAAVANLTSIPLQVRYKFDLEHQYVYQDGERCGWLTACRPNYVSGKSDYQNGVTGTTNLDAREKAKPTKWFDNIDYYTGYYVKREYSDGRFTYDYDEARSFKAINYSITGIHLSSVITPDAIEQLKNSEDYRQFVAAQVQTKETGEESPDPT